MTSVNATSFLVRPVGGYGLNTQLRITIGTEHENTRLLTALVVALKQG